MDIDEPVDVIQLMLAIIIGLFFVSFGTDKLMKLTVPPDLPDKTAVTSFRAVDPIEYQWTVRDYLLMLMVADDLCPEPKAVDIKFGSSQEDTLVEFKGDYFKLLDAKLQQYYINYLHSRLDMKISKYDYYYEEGKVDRWRFETAGN